MIDKLMFPATIEKLGERYLVNSWKQVKSLMIANEWKHCFVVSQTIKDTGTNCTLRNGRMTRS